MSCASSILRYADIKNKARRLVCKSRLESVEIGSSIGTENNRGDGVNRPWYRVFWVFEVVAILVVVFVLTVPIQDYALREFNKWYSHPSPETLKAFQEKRQEEFRLRLTIADPFGAAALLLAFPLVRFRSKSRKSN